MKIQQIKTKQNHMFQQRIMSFDRRQDNG